MERNMGYITVHVIGVFEESVRKTPTQAQKLSAQQASGPLFGGAKMNVCVARVTKRTGTSHGFDENHRVYFVDKRV
jgi:hypothetical protein